MSVARLPDNLFSLPGIFETDPASGRITSLSLRPAEQHRGIEKQLERTEFRNAPLLLSKTSSLMPAAITAAFCAAAEEIAEISISPRAAALRMLYCEKERAMHHLLYLEEIAVLTSADDTAAKARGLNDMLSPAGNSSQDLFRGYSVISGVANDIQLQEAAEIQSAANRVIETVRKLLSEKRFTAFLSRLAGKGVLTRTQAEDFGLTGPLARACGVQCDIRRRDAYLAYHQQELNEITGSAGDASERVAVHVKETVEACRIVANIAAALPSGKISERDFDIPPGTADTRVECPQGELLCHLETDGSGKPFRVKLGSPAIAAAQALKAILTGADMEDARMLAISAPACPFLCAR